MFAALNFGNKADEKYTESELKKLLIRIDMKKLEMRYKRNG